MKQRFIFIAVMLVMLLSACSKYKYEEVKGDPMQSRIYTLDNGLKVYMTVNKDEPRIQTFIAVKVGAKNDPKETTGLAHYFEHLMFKGTEQFGTMNYAEEKPLLDEIERLFEVYRTTEDAAQRKALYAQIDSVSQLASKLFIPNEYDKLMSAIGAAGTNAWTSMDETVYTENIPSNQIENWAKIQSDRFANNVIRGFHTELETVYEEYNMSLTRDGSKAYYALLSQLFPNHPYGQQTVLGSQEHLKNPSITNIKNYYRTYYVPNNMAICLSGDFDPDYMIEVIDRYFGTMKPNNELPQLSTPAEEPITSPKVKSVYGLESPFIYMGWRTEGDASSEDALYASLISSILNNGRCGLLDVNIMQQQKCLSAGAFDLMLSDRGAIVVAGYPKQGQSLEDVKALLLGEIEKLRKGDFDESLLKSIVANYKRYEMMQMEQNENRAESFVDAFIAGREWRDVVEENERLEKITKEQIVEWAGKVFADNNYVEIHKLQGEDTNQKKIDKPTITPIEANRDAVSDFLKGVKESTVEPIAPRFIDFEKDMTRQEIKPGMELLYNQNTDNQLFSLIYLYDFGTNSDPMMSYAFDYLDLLGTDTKSVEQIQRAFYDLACDLNVYSTGRQTYININGISENMEAAMALAEEYMANLKADEKILAELKADKLKARADRKFNQQANFNALRNYVYFGADAIRTMTLSNEEISSMTSEELIGRVQSLKDYEHRVLYYGPLTVEELKSKIEANHTTAERLMMPRVRIYPFQLTPENRVILAQYDAKQIYFQQFTNLGRCFSAENDAVVALYNDYFGGGMNAIVFQEMREARALAYSSYAYLSEGHQPLDPYLFYAFIATQNDKMATAIDAFDEIINNMPESEAAFTLAKESLISQLSTLRVNGEDVLWCWVNLQQKGLDKDRNKLLYEKVQNMTLEDVKRLQQEWIKDSKYIYCILGDKNDLDMYYLRQLGPIQEVSQQEIFGY